MTASLPAFAIDVVDVSIGGATLSWTAPTQNTDGSALSNLSGYRIYYGASADELTHTVQVANAGITTYLIENLAPGTYYFAVRAYSSSGNESGNSNLASKVGAEKENALRGDSTADARRVGDTSAAVLCNFYACHRLVGLM